MNSHITWRQLAIMAAAAIAFLIILSLSFTIKDGILMVSTHSFTFVCGPQTCLVSR